VAVIKSNDRIAAGVYRMTLSGAPLGRAGQFYMLRIPGALDPLLGRPISVFESNAEAGELTFLYQSIGRGTAQFSARLPGQAIDAQGPYGNGFLLEPGPAVVIGGGIGTAPLHHATSVSVNIGGIVTDSVDFTLDATYYACGPAPMLRAAAGLAKAANAKLYVSLEKRMACGVGACLGCTCQTAGGGKRVCKDGPVFDYREVQHVL